MSSPTAESFKMCLAVYATDRLSSCIKLDDVPAALIGEISSEVAGEMWCYFAVNRVIQEIYFFVILWVQSFDQQLNLSLR